MSAKPWLIIIILVMLLAACQPAATPQPTVQPLRVQLTPLLETSWLPKLNACSSYLSQSNLLIDIRDVSKLDPQTADLTIRTSANLESENEGSYLGAERLALVVNSKNPTVSLSQEEAGAIFAGTYAQWREVPSSAATGQTFDQPIKLIFLVDPELSAFLSATFPDLGVTPPPDEQAYSVEMFQQLIAEAQGAIGLLPASALTSALKEIQILGLDGQPVIWQLHVLGLTSAEPSGDIMQLLLCLQIEPQR